MVLVYWLFILYI